MTSDKNKMRIAEFLFFFGPPEASLRFPLRVLEPHFGNLPVEDGRKEGGDRKQMCWLLSCVEAAKIILL